MVKRIVAGVAFGLALLGLSSPAFALKGDRASGRGTANAVSFSFHVRGTGSDLGAVGSFDMTDTSLFGGSVSGDVNCLYAYTLTDGTESVGLVEGTITKATDTAMIGKYVHWIGTEINVRGGGSGFWTEAPTTTATDCSFIVPSSVWAVEKGRVSISSS